MSEKTKKPEQKSKSRFIKPIAAVTLAATVAFVGARKLEQMDDNNERRVAAQEATEAIDGGRVKGVETQTFFFREGVAFRTDPNIVDDKDGNTNKFYSVPKGKTVRAEQVANIVNEQGDSFLMFSFQDGEESRVAYVSSKVLGQVNEQGDDYVVRFTETREDITEYDPHSLMFDSEANKFFVTDDTIPSAHELNYSDAFASLANNE